MLEDLIKLSDRELYQHVIDQIFDFVQLHHRGSEFQKALVGQHIASGLIGNRGMHDHPPEEIEFYIRSYEVLGFDAIAKVLRDAQPLIKLDTDEPLTEEMLMSDDYEEPEDDPRLEELENEYYRLDKKAHLEIVKKIRANLAAALKCE
ncbi:MAG: hypothetical protein AB8C95_09155 [Phycisphaeraceae bacterium]